MPRLGTAGYEFPTITISEHFDGAIPWPVTLYINHDIQVLPEGRILGATAITTGSPQSPPDTAPNTIGPSTPDPDHIARPEKASGWTQHSLYHSR